MVIFFNKIDIFERKIADDSGNPLTLCFPLYAGQRHSVEDACEFIREQFDREHPIPDKELYAHYTNATDTENLKIVFDVVTDVILKELLAKCSLF